MADRRKWVSIVPTRLHSLKSGPRPHQGQKLVRYTLTSGRYDGRSRSARSSRFYGFRIIPSVMLGDVDGQPDRHRSRPTTQPPLGLGQAGQQPLPRRDRAVLAMTSMGIAFAARRVWARHEVTGPPLEPPRQHRTGPGHQPGLFRGLLGAETHRLQPHLPRGRDGGDRRGPRPPRSGR